MQPHEQALSAQAPGAQVPAAQAPPGEAVVTRKSGYVHVLWDAAEPTKNGASIVRGALLGSVARLVAAKLSGSDPGDVRVDIVVVLVKDGYGKPKWDSLKRVGKVQAKRERLAAWAAASSGGGEPPESLFEKVEWF